MTAGYSEESGHRRDDQKLPSESGKRHPKEYIGFPDRPNQQPFPAGQF
ncbi:MAG TPA: hypothetical protein VGB18_03150 [Candidatus Thermoplasmatota archaeon]